MPHTLRLYYEREKETAISYIHISYFDMICKFEGD